MTHQPTTFLERVLSNIDDDTERELVAAQIAAGNEYDAAADGSLHYAHSAHVADRMFADVKRRYDDASRALIEYRRTR